LYNVEKKIYDFNKKLDPVLEKNRKNSSKALEMKIARYKEEQKVLKSKKGELQSEVDKVINKYTSGKIDDA